MNEKPKTSPESAADLQKEKKHSASTNGMGNHQAEESAQPQSDSDQRIKELESLLTSEKNRYLYLAAEFENFKKRNQAERVQLLRFGAENLARDMIQTLDNLERASEHKKPENFQALAEGIDLVLKQFKLGLSNHGVQPIDSLGKPFDPSLHEAMGQEVSTQPEGTVLKEHSKGYTLFDRLLRPAKVVLSRPS